MEGTRCVDAASLLIGWSYQGGITGVFASLLVLEYVDTQAQVVNKLRHFKCLTFFLPKEKLNPHPCIV